VRGAEEGARQAGDGVGVAAGRGRTGEGRHRVVGVVQGDVEAVEDLEALVPALTRMAVGEWQMCATDPGSTSERSRPLTDPLDAERLSVAEVEACADFCATWLPVAKEQDEVQCSGRPGKPADVVRRLETEDLPDNDFSRRDRHPRGVADTQFERRRIKPPQSVVLVAL
jgi:hypothetical protein